MREKIKQKLMSQRGSNNQVTDKTLEVMAATLEKLITTDEILATIDFTDQITSMQGNIGHIASDAVKNAATLAAEKAATEKAATEKAAAEKKAAEEAEKNGEQPDIAKLISDALSPIVTELNGLKTEKVTQSRGELLQAKIAETPVLFKDATTKAFKHMTFATDDDFNEFLTETETGAKEAIQIGNESGLPFTTPTVDVNKPDPDAVSEAMEKTLVEITTDKKEKQPF